MTNATAAALALLIVLLAGADWFINDAAGLTFLGRRMIDLVEWVAFWR